MTVDDIRAAPRRVAPNREEEIMGSITQPLFDEDKAQGLAQGKAGALARLLSRRFGPLPTAVRRRLDAVAIGQTSAEGQPFLLAVHPRQLRLRQRAKGSAAFVHRLGPIIQLSGSGAILDAWIGAARHAAQQGELKYKICSSPLNYRKR